MYQKFTTAQQGGINFGLYIKLHLQNQELLVRLQFLTKVTASLFDFVPVIVVLCQGRFVQNRVYIVR
jgi:hypothetical protein